MVLKLKSSGLDTSFSKKHQILQDEFGGL